MNDDEITVDAVMAHIDELLGKWTEEHMHQLTKEGRPIELTPELESVVRGTFRSGALVALKYMALLKH